MATTVIEECRLHYELLGPEGAPCLVLTPGGRAAMAPLRVLADRLAQRFRILLWDRRNTGASDVYFTRQRFEQHIWADDLAELLRQLGLAPCYLGGGSAGSRVSLLTAIRHPEVAKGLVLWSVTGGPFACQVLGYTYHVPYIRAAQKGGMEEVARTEFFAERIAMNPHNRERLLSMDPDTFIEVMRYWDTFFYYRHDSPVLGASERDLRSIRTPALVFEGNDDIHTREASAALKRLVPNAEIMPSAWPAKEFYDIYTGRVQGGLMQGLYPRMADPISAFLEEVESRA